VLVLVIIDIAGISAPCETAMGDGAEGWGGGIYEVVAVVGSCVCETRGEERVWVEIPKPSRCGSVSGAPCETAMGDSAQGWGGGTYEVVVVVGSCVRETRGAERVGQKTRNRAAVARFRAAVGLQEVEGGAVGLQLPLPC